MTSSLLQHVFEVSTTSFHTSPESLRKASLIESCGRWSHTSFGWNVAF